MKLIFEKLFRIRENEKKVRFILENSDFNLEFIEKAAVLAKRPGYHTFGHALGVAEQAIRIAQAEGRSKPEINRLVFSGLFHDAGHTGTVRLFDEMYAFIAASEVVTAEEIECTGLSFGASLAQCRDLILATTFSNRGKNNDPLARILQDADLAHLGLGVYYWPWASMGLVDEFRKMGQDKLTPEIFIWEDQEKFINYLLLVSDTGKVFLSEGANKIFFDPVETVQELKTFPKEAIDFAYSVRREDITVEEFTKEIDSILHCAVV